MLRFMFGCFAIGLAIAAGIGSPNAKMASAEEASWLIDFEKAKELAKKEGKDLLLDFTGSDWCSFCIKLDNNVFSKDIFAAKIPEKFVLVKIDSPRDKSKQSDAEQKMVKELVKKYSISGYPTILLTDAEGRPYASLVGYDGSPADKYVTDLIDKQGVRQKRDELLEKAAAASGAAKAKLLDEAISPLDPELTLQAYGDVIDQIIEADAGNEAGLKNKYTQLRSAVAFKGKLQDVMRAIKGPQDLAAAATKIEKLIADSEVGGEAKQEGLFILAQIQFNTDKQKAKETLEKALQAAPKTQMAAQIESVLKRFFSEQKVDGESGGESADAGKKQ